MNTQFLDFLNRLRDSGHRSTLPDVIEEAKKQGISLSARDAKQLAARLNIGNGSSIPLPEWLEKLLGKYCQTLAAKTILDPIAGYGFLLGPLVARINPERAIGLISSQVAVSVASTLYLDSRIDWVSTGFENNIEWLQQTDQLFDLIVGFPPMGGTKRKDTATGISDEWGFLTILHACRKLAQRGKAVFIVTEGFFFRSPVRDALAGHGLYLDAVLSVPVGTFRPVTGISTDLVVISHQEHETLFVAELNDSEKRNNGVLNLLKQRKAVNTFGMGALVKSDEFRGYQSFAAEQRTKLVAEQAGLVPVALTDVAIQVNSINTTRSPVFANVGNTLYLPTRPGPAFTSPSELTAHNYFEIVLDSNKAVAAYIVRQFNSPLGRALRSTVESGITIPYIRKKALDNLVLYLPPLEVQQRIIEADIQAETFINELSELRQQLWTSPQIDSEAAAKLQGFFGTKTQQLDRFEDWVDTLPFPLASILWAYHASNDPFKRYRLLQRYFEGLAQFIATVLFSGFYYDDDWMRAANGCFFDKDGKELLRQATFGTWLTIVEHFIRRLHKTLEKKPTSDEYQRISHLFSAPADIVQLVLPREIIDVLKKTNSLRNEWRGHGGIDDGVAKARLPTLEEHLNETRRILGRNWRQFQLVKPGSVKKVAGVYHQEIELLMGHHNPFVSDSIRVGEVLDASSLYFYADGMSTALKLQPLILILTKVYGEENACYFFGRIAQSGTTFISHHYEREPDRTELFPETIQALENIRRSQGDIEV